MHTRVLRRTCTCTTLLCGTCINWLLSSRYACKPHGSLCLHMVFAQATSVHGQIACLTNTLPLHIHTCLATAQRTPVMRESDTSVRRIVHVTILIIVFSQPLKAFSWLLSISVSCEKCPASVTLDAHSSAPTPIQTLRVVAQKSYRKGRCGEVR